MDRAGDEKLKQSIFIVFLITIPMLAACSTAMDAAPSSTGTPNPVQAYVNSNLSQATAVSAIATAQFYTGQLTATVEAANLASTAQAESMSATQQAVSIASTQQTWSATATAGSAQATTIASETSSAVAVQAMWTERAVSITSTADAASVQAFATEQFGKSQETEMQLERDRSMNNVRAAAPWALLFFGVTFTALIAYRWTRVRVIQRDERGDAPLLLNTIDGIAYDADRHPVSTAGLLRSDLQRLPQLSAESHTQTTARDQMLDLVTRLPDSPRLQEKLTAALASPDPKSAPQVQVITEEQARTWLKDVMPHLLQDAVDGEIISTEKGDKEL